MGGFGGMFGGFAGAGGFAGVGNVGGFGGGFGGFSGTNPFGGVGGFSGASGFGNVGGGGVGATGGNFGGVGGTNPFGGAGGIAVGGSGGTGGVNTDPQCEGIANNVACSIQGKECPSLMCGLGHSGRRTCICATNWTCTSCDYTNSWIRDRPPAIPQCLSAVVEGEPCATGVDSPSSVCAQSQTRFCVCATNPRAPTAPPEWDCDAAPSSWI